MDRWIDSSADEEYSVNMVQAEARTIVRSIRPTLQCNVRAYSLRSNLSSLTLITSHQQAALALHRFKR
jgi:hypothetical protein